MSILSVMEDKCTIHFNRKIILHKSVVIYTLKSSNLRVSILFKIYYLKKQTDTHGTRKD